MIPSQAVYVREQLTVYSHDALMARLQYDAIQVTSANGYSTQISRNDLQCMSQTSLSVAELHNSNAPRHKYFTRRAILIHPAATIHLAALSLQAVPRHRALLTHPAPPRHPGNFVHQTVVMHQAL